MGKRTVTITHPERIYFPSGFRKVDMIRYYGAVAEVMLPHLRDRPVTLIRYPEGVTWEKFYEKNAPAHAPRWIRTCPVARRHHEGSINYIVVNDVETLAWCANLGAIEFHPFLHRARALDRPTQLAFDLDPGDGADLLTCIEVARILRRMFENLGLNCYPKVTGSKGLQLYVPLNSRTSYDITTPFAKAVAELLARQFPELVASDMSKTLRRGRVLIDWSQNSAAKTTVCAYSLRGKHDEPFVSTPVTWAELDRAAKNKDKASLFFGPDQVLQRVARRGDLFAPVLSEKQTLPAAAVSGAETKATRSPKGSLGRYAEKRDFARTSEPKPRRASARPTGTVRRFVIQKHAASHLHYDFRLEMGGTLKSWAVPKGLPYETGIRRSAFEVEDHPLDYMTFEGTIPKGQYGGGTVMVWDLGTYDVIKGSHEAGDLKLRLKGKKLKGEWHIFRIRSERDKPVWLVIKSGESMKPLTARQEDSSVLSRRSMKRIASDDDAQWQSNRGGAGTAVKKRRARARKASPAA